MMSYLHSKAGQPEGVNTLCEATAESDFLAAIFERTVNNIAIICFSILINIYYIHCCLLCHDCFTLQLIYIKSWVIFTLPFELNNFFDIPLFLYSIYYYFDIILLFADLSVLFRRKQIISMIPCANLHKNHWFFNYMIFNYEDIHKFISPTKITPKDLSKVKGRPEGVF